jgi:hypothetical protein
VSGQNCWLRWQRMENIGPSSSGKHEAASPLRNESGRGQVSCRLRQIDGEVNQARLFGILGDWEGWAEGGYLHC